MKKPKIELGKNLKFASIKNLTNKHICLLATYLQHTVLGEGVGQIAAFELIEAFEVFVEDTDLSSAYDLGFELNVSCKDGPEIIITHESD